MGCKVYLYIAYDAYLRFSMSWRSQWTVAIVYLVLGLCQPMIPALGVRPAWVFWVSASIWISFACISLHHLRREWNRERLGHDTRLSRLGEFSSMQVIYIGMFEPTGLLWSKCSNPILAKVGFTIGISIYGAFLLTIVGACVLARFDYRKGK